VPVVVGVDGGPGVAVGGDLEVKVRAYAVSQSSTTEVMVAVPEVDLQPLRVAERAGPAGARVAVDGVRGGEGGGLGRGGVGGLPVAEISPSAALAELWATVT
jgi:hypothetical protein